MKFDVGVSVGRNPLPDYYSITLEISRDRMTSARRVTCTEESNRCPASVDVGDAFLRRDINTACHKMVRTSLDRVLLHLSRTRALRQLTAPFVCEFYPSAITVEVFDVFSIPHY